MRTTTIITAALFVWGCSGPPPAPVEVELRAGVSEFCTTCNDVIVCERADVDTAADLPPVIVYNLLPDTFWQQVATIWDWLIQWIKPITIDVRAMTAYELDSLDNGEPRVVPGQQATVNGPERRIAVPGGYIDQVSGDWYRSGTDGDRRVGQCELLKFVDGLALLRRLQGTDQGGETS